MRKTIAALIAAGAAALLLAACGAKRDQIQPIASRVQTVTMMLDASPNANHVGIYEAMAKGYLEDAGVKLRLETPPSPNAPLAEVEARKVNVAIVSEPQLIIARDEMGVVLSFAALVQRPLTSIISIGSRHITKISQLRGKTVGITGIPFQTDLLNTMLDHAKVAPSSVKRVDVGSDLVSSMLSGQVDATIGGSENNQALQLRDDHKNPHVIPVSAGGVPSYQELVLVTTEKYFENHVTLLRGLVQALGRGYAAVRADPQQGINALLSADPSLDPTLQATAVRASLPSFFPSDDKPWGWQFSDQWNAFGLWMYDHHLIKHLAARDYASTNQLLAGQGP